VVLLSGALFAVSAANSEGTDLRPGRYTDLASLVEAEAAETGELTDRLTELKKQVDTLTDDVDDEEVRRLRDAAAGLRDPAGMEPRSGPGVTVVLSDAPEDLLEQAAEEGLKVDPWVVHQQDIQAVVPYPQPYEIQAVGDPDAIVAALDLDPRVIGYRADAADPAIQVGWDLEIEDEVEAPAYTGLQDLSYAQPLR
jgi:uncharacterized protein YlxW (UPF0749 family)